MRRMIFFALSISLICQFAWAQWQRVTNVNAGATGRVASHGSAVFLYGYEGGYKLHRSTDNGTTWVDISSSATAAFVDIFSFNGMLYASYLSTVYTSTDLGQSWTPLSGVTVTGTGALLGFASDGTTLYAFSNRKSVFRSTNNGASWTELLINSTANLLIIDFAARGNRYAAVVANAGAYISEDAGATWTLRNPTVGAGGIYGFNNTLFGLSFGGGVFTMQNGSSSWIAANSGVPSNGSLVVPRAPASQGSAIYLGFQQLVSNYGSVVRSTDGGASWTELDTAGLPTSVIPGVGGTRYVAATPTHVYYFYYGGATQVGVYRTAGLPSAVREVASEIPNGFSLEQNYPNPFNPSTRIAFAVQVSGFTSLRVYDVLGKEVATLVNENLNAGSYETTFDASGLASGVYFYRLEAGAFSLTKRLMLLR
ncbi:MAG: T9SS type A sorting domain-containing protein [Ignavibacteriae bacterium]|nr:T9SS type A sorting domain-containing protein [Ignavibacteriota bacterium]